MTNSINNTNEITITADVFLLPELAPVTMKHSFGRQIMETMIAEFFKQEQYFPYQNSFSVTSVADKYSKVWFSNDELADNLGCHGFTVDGYTYIPRETNGTMFNFVPSGICSLLKEGVPVTLKTNIPMKRDSDGEIVDICISIIARPSQLNYRYKSYGKFEDAYIYSTCQ